ncbi:MAG: uroporphyrinogen-III synthase [Epsilonproteobacteria bacterium]|nr:uroporphyrinogen-III synthase [Campylobacterota bacterium]
MISFEITANSIDFSNCDTLMFTSKQAVVSADSIDKSWKDYPSIAIGGATKNKIEELGGEVIYYPKKFYGEVLANDIKEQFSNRKILYLRPQIVSFDSRGFLAKEGIILDEQIIYKTSCQKYDISQKPKKGAIIIFTSPSTIKCFFENFSWDSSYRAILIGNATKEHLPKECKYAIADEPLIDSCIKKAKEILFRDR